MCILWVRGSVWLFCWLWFLYWCIYFVDLLVVFSFPNIYNRWIDSRKQLIRKSGNKILQQIKIQMFLNITNLLMKKNQNRSLLNKRKINNKQKIKLNRVNLKNINSMNGCQTLIYSSLLKIKNKANKIKLLNKLKKKGI